MESEHSGTLAGTGSFRCEDCGYVVSRGAEGPTEPCPSCGGERFTRASLAVGGAGRFARREPTPEERNAFAQAARAHLTETGAAPGQYLAYTDGDALRTIGLTREWTRIGRSLAAEIRFDDPTVSRRHALVVRQADGFRVTDDRSLNGVFVNGERVEWRALVEGDEILVGRHRLVFLDHAAVPAA